MPLSKKIPIFEQNFFSLNKILRIMKRFSFFVVLFFALALGGIGQGNLVVNPSFEELYGCPSDYAQIDTAIGWHILLAGGGGNPEVYNVCCTNINNNCGVPINNNGGFEFPHSGNGYAGIDAYYSTEPDNFREYIQSKLVKELKSGERYCVSFYCSLMDGCQAYIRPLGAYFDNGTVSASSWIGLAVATPQVFNTSIALADKINWMKIEGSFLASANENYITIGNFFNDAASDTGNFGPGASFYWAYYYIDDVSVIDADLPATAGNDILIHPGDSTFIGRPSEVGLDDDCIWFVNGIPIDTIAGLWVKPDTTTTYVLQQTICGNVKYDTITVTVSGVGVEQYNNGGNWVCLSPNPASTQINIESNSPISEINIIDVSGKMILKRFFGRSREGFFERSREKIDISTLARGLYFIKIISDKQSLVRKFLKE
jgi:hypothetical protein